VRIPSPWSGRDGAPQTGREGSGWWPPEPVFQVNCPSCLTGLLGRPGLLLRVSSSTFSQRLRGPSAVVAQFQSKVRSSLPFSASNNSAQWPMVTAGLTRPLRITVRNDRPRMASRCAGQHSLERLYDPILKTFCEISPPPVHHPCTTRVLLRLAHRAFSVKSGEQQRSMVRTSNQSTGRCQSVPRARRHATVGGVWVESSSLLRPGPGNRRPSDRPSTRSGSLPSIRITMRNGDPPALAHQHSRGDCLAWRGNDQTCWSLHRLFRCKSCHAGWVPGVRRGCSSAATLRPARLGCALIEHNGSNADRAL